MAKPAGRALVDTSALLALANPRDQYHARAVALARPFAERGGRFVLSVLVLAEFHAHLLYRAGPQRAREVTAALLADPAYDHRDVSPDLIRAAVSAWLERFHDQRFSLADAVSFEVMRRERIAAAFAFDRHFHTAGFELLRMGE